MSQKIIIVLLAAFTFSCGQKGFQSSSVNKIGQTTPDRNADTIPDDNNNSNNTGSGGSSGNSGGGTTKPSLSLDGLISSNDSLTRNKLAYRLDSATKEIVFSIPIPTTLIINSSGRISAIPGARYGTELDTNNKPIFVVRIPAHFIVDGIQNLKQGRLPNGNPLPSMPLGYSDLPAVEVPIKIGNYSVNMHIYLNKKAIGVYIEMPTLISLPVDLSYMIKSLEKSVLGYFSIIAPRNGAKGGLMVSLLPSQSLTTQLNEFLKN